MNDPAAQRRALDKIEQALGLLREAQEELRGWAPPTAVNDLEAAQSVLQGIRARLPELK